MRALYISRYVALVGSLIGAVVVVGTGADLLSTTLEFFDLYFTFNVLAIAVAGLTILTLVPMLIVDGVRDRPFTSLVYVELIWLTILWILWLSSGAYSIWVDSFVYGTRSCNFPGYPAYSKACSEWNAISAFSLINWIFLMSYTVALFVMALIARSNGYRGFTATVREGFGSGAPREPAIPPSASNLNVGDAEKVMTSTQSIPHSRDAPVVAPSSAHTEMPQTGIQRPYNYLPEV